MKRKLSHREYKDYISDIASAVEKVEKFVKGFTLKDFKKDEKTIFAVTRALEIIGEAVGKIPTSVKKQHKEIPWKHMSGMRNKLIHEYFGVNVKVVWKTVKEDMPVLKNKMSEVLDELKIKKLL